MSTVRYCREDSGIPGVRAIHQSWELRRRDRTRDVYAERYKEAGRPSGLSSDTYRADPLLSHEVCKEDGCIQAW